MEKIVSLTKRRGFFYPGSEIYGGVGGIYDLGPLGVELANNIKTAWWKNIVRERDNVVGLDSAILMNRQVWHTSGHVESFADPLVECKNCHSRFREDILPKSKNCPTCGKNDWTSARMFNLMFKTHIGPVEGEANETFLRPETAQGIFVNFGNVVDTMRVKLPFGIAQVGKGFRNEITTGNFLFRVREFEMMELEYFTFSEKAEKDFDYWQKERMDWHISLGLRKENLRFREHESDERAHYATRSVDIEYNWPFMGWGELEGIANRTDYDLKQHSKESGKDISYFDEEIKKKIIPYVIEPSIGVGRMMLALLINAYTEEKAPTAEKGESETRVVLKLRPGLAPVKVAVLPLVKDEKLIKIAKEIYKDLKKEWNVIYDEAASIGRRYRRQDEIGTPFCVTVDFDTLKDKSVTMRDRDSMKQDRIKIENLKKRIGEELN
ncbi:MAG: glycine--tRNA ligase [Candidatus Woykebacteria bacterium RBG_16_39_9b]|uniref:Glycine--tRNA ligase n=1 Tax=Candidatus Woykebacteria bacterium RBG_16_39_9b TaxID=1802595 RepID=A0A1G1WD98_9BACT|nr:MAG: glycine--tRNA ligase [Candidatus Woykebacteria bacterium RBG_16_39_9b]